MATAKAAIIEFMSERSSQCQPGRGVGMPAAQAVPGRCRRPGRLGRRRAGPGCRVRICGDLPSLPSKIMPPQLVGAHWRVLRGAPAAGPARASDVGHRLVPEPSARRTLLRPGRAHSAAG